MSNENKIHELAGCLESINQKGYKDSLGFELKYNAELTRAREIVGEMSGVETELEPRPRRFSSPVEECYDRPQGTGG